MITIPEWYVQWIARVSELVGFKYPFSLEDDTRFTEWLWDKWIAKDDYMNTATSWGTNLHNLLEYYILWKPETITMVHPVWIEYDHWIRYIDQLKEEFKDCEWHPEYFIKDEWNRFQWTIDLVRINWNKVFLYDYKSYEIAKKKYWLPQKLLKSWLPPKPTLKMKKVALQLSLYAQYFIQKWYEIWWIYLVWLHSSWAHEYKLDLWKTEDIDLLCFNFLTQWINMEWINIDVKSPLKIRMQTAPIAYSAVEVELDLSKLDNWMSCKEAINEAIIVQKMLHNSYIDKSE